MGDWWKQWLRDFGWTQSLLFYALDLGLVLALTYMVLVIIGERRTLWMVRGFIVLMLASAMSARLGLTLLNFVLEKLVVGSAVAMAVAFQSEFRRFWNNWEGVNLSSCCNHPTALSPSLIV